MAPESAASDVARRLWAITSADLIAVDPGDPAAAAAAVKRLNGQLRIGLGRWIGAPGYLALVERALRLTRDAHPALMGVLGATGDAPAAGTAWRADEIEAALLAWLAALIELLGRIIGDDMALRLVEQVGTPGAPGVSGTRAE